LSWAIFTLCTLPEQQARCYEEVHKVFEAKAAKGEESKLSYQDIAACKYLEAFCMEVLRLYPSVPKEGKYAPSRLSPPHRCSLG
jgi:cytochrome P450